MSDVRPEERRPTGDPVVDGGSVPVNTTQRVHEPGPYFRLSFQGILNSLRAHIEDFTYRYGTSTSLGQPSCLLGVRVAEWIGKPEQIHQERFHLLGCLCLGVDAASSVL